MKARAKVLSVTKSAAGLRKGDEIEIHYRTPDPTKRQEPGAPPSLVKKGVRYTAYLKVSEAGEKRFEPAAHSGSFSLLE